MAGLHHIAPQLFCLNLSLQAIVRECRQWKRSLERGRLPVREERSKRIQVIKTAWEAPNDGGAESGLLSVP